MENKKPSLLAKLVNVLLLFLAITGHFYLCVRFVHWMGDPLKVPDWLYDVNRLFRWGPENFAAFIFLILWIIFLIGSIFFYRYLAELVSNVLTGNMAAVKKGFSKKENPPAPVPVSAEKNVNEISPENKPEEIPDGGSIALKLLAPFMILVTLTLILIPIQSTKGITHDTMMTEGSTLSFEDFIVFMTDASFMILMAMLVLFLPFIFIGLVFEIKPKRFEPGMGTFFLSILLGIAGGVSFGFFGFPFFEWVHVNYEGTASLFVIFGAYALLSVIGMSIHKKENVKTVTQKNSSKK